MSESLTPFCKASGDDRIQAILQPFAQDDTRSEGDRDRLLCRFCHQSITSGSCRIAFAGSHCHTFTNPCGHTFQIGCFSQAPGCGNKGMPTFDHTWFPGFAWTFSLCAGCREHLGWHYDGGDGTYFFGLILANLVEEKEQ